MQRCRAFTLVEMLAVVSIMLILLGVSYAVLSSLAQQSGPEAVLATIQAAIHNARDYAASAGTPARIEFRFTDPTATNPGPDDQMPSSTVRLQYWSDEFDEWVNVPGRGAVALPQGIYVCKGIPSVSQLPPSMPNDPADVTDQQVEQWQAYEQEVLDDIGEHAFQGGSGPGLKNEHDKFYIIYGPQGYPISSNRLSALDPDIDPSKVLDGSGSNGLTIVHVGGTRVTAYAFYLWNQNTGTRLVFE